MGSCTTEEVLDGQSIKSVCKEYPDQTFEGQSLSDAMDECWSCCAYATDRTKELTDYKVVDENCICTHELKSTLNN